MSTTTNFEFETLTIPKEFFSHKGPALTDHNGGIFVHSTIRFELVPYLGALRHVEGATHPAKGIPTPAAVYQLNHIKTFIKEATRYLPVLLLFVSKDKLARSFIEIFDRSFKPYMVERLYLCKSAYQTYRFLTEFFDGIGVGWAQSEELAYRLAHIMEYDDAWRYIAQDLATESNEYELITRPRREIKRLLTLLEERSTKVVSTKLIKMANIILLLLVIPKYKRAFVHASQYIKGMQFDEADRYWVSFRDDYKFHGKSFEERSKGVKIPPLYEIFN